MVRITAKPEPICCWFYLLCCRYRSCSSRTSTVRAAASFECVLKICKASLIHCRHPDSHPANRNHCTRGHSMFANICDILRPKALAKGPPITNYVDTFVRRDDYRERLSSAATGDVGSRTPVTTLPPPSLSTALGRQSQLVRCVRANLRKKGPDTLYEDLCSG